MPYCWYQERDTTWTCIRAKMYLSYVRFPQPFHWHEFCAQDLELCKNSQSSDLYHPESQYSCTLLVAAKAARIANGQTDGLQQHILYWHLDGWPYLRLTFNKTVHEVCFTAYSACTPARFKGFHPQSRTPSYLLPKTHAYWSSPPSPSSPPAVVPFALYPCSPCPSL